jgi:PTS system ascorbate-specific IIA component
MLLRAMTYRREPLEALTARAMAGGTQGVMQVAAPRRQNQPVPPGRHDSVLHHDQ